MMSKKNARAAGLILPDGASSRGSPSDGKKFELEELQGFVEGWVEVVRLSNGQHLYVNEEGKMCGMEYNVEATMLTNSQHEIVGPALLMDGKRAS